MKSRNTFISVLFPCTAATFQVLAANKHEAQMRYHNELFKQKRYSNMIYFHLTFIIATVTNNKFISNRKVTLAAEAGGPGKSIPSSPQLAQAKVCI